MRGKVISERKTPAVAVIIAAIIVLVAVLYFYFTQPAQPNIPKPEVTQGLPESAPTAGGSASAIPESLLPTSGVPQSMGAASSPCDGFPDVPNEITCGQAVKTALEKYPGEVYYLNKEDAWVIGIKLQNNATIVNVDKYKGEII